MTGPRSTARYWALVPAAGIGRRFGSEVPKQYLSVAGRAVIAHSVERLLAEPRIQGVLIGLAPDDRFWAHVPLRHARLLGTYVGGADRAATVLKGLAGLQQYAAPDDWVLVHDAVRPCVRVSDIASLIDGVGDDADGGLLGATVADTVKRADTHRHVTETIEREGLWRAFTPQMFRLHALTQALTRMQRAGKTPTDEAQAIEFSGGHPRMITGHTDNIKITVADDLALAELFLKRQRERVS